MPIPRVQDVGTGARSMVGGNAWPDLVLRSRAAGMPARIGNLSNPRGVKCPREMFVKPLGYKKGAPGPTRTGTPIMGTGPQPAAYTNSATGARESDFLLGFAHNYIRAPAPVKFRCRREWAFRPSSRQLCPGILVDNVRPHVTPLGRRVEQAFDNFRGHVEVTVHARAVECDIQDALNAFPAAGLGGGAGGVGVVAVPMPAQRVFNGPLR